MIFCFMQKTAYELRISDWSSDVCSSDLQDRTVDGDLDRDPVADDDGAVAVEDPSPRRLDGDLADAVGLGDDLEVVVGHHLEVPEAREERGEEREHDDPEDRQAQAGRILVHGRPTGTRRARASCRKRPWPSARPSARKSGV